MIYGLTGNPLTIQRLGTIEDIRTLDGREPDDGDRIAIADGAYVVSSDSRGKLRLYHVARLRADNGSSEISAVLAACAANGGVAS
jgi:hypothetical protein